MNHSLGLMIETLVAILLVLTIGYCMLLNQRPEAAEGRRALAESRHRRA